MNAIKICPACYQEVKNAVKYKHICALAFCGMPINPDKIISKKIRGQVNYFCCEKCSEKYLEHHQKK